MRIHDEARLRLRHKAADGSPSKSGTSSVQRNVLSLRAGAGEPLEVHRRLEALENKTAETIATSLERALRDTAAAVGASVSAGFLV